MGVSPIGGGTRRDSPSWREEERDFDFKRDKSFGSPDYPLKRELEARLLALRGVAFEN